MDGCCSYLAGGEAFNPAEIIQDNDEQMTQTCDTVMVSISRCALCLNTSQHLTAVQTKQ